LLLASLNAVLRGARSDDKGAHAEIAQIRGTYWEPTNAEVLA
jgi:hypothetical protein